MLYKKLLLSFLLLMVVTASAYAGELDTEKYRQAIGLDYSMPDYTTDKIDAKVMGPRLASILMRLNQDYLQLSYLELLNMIQTEQVDNLSYGRIKKMKLKSVSKKGNEIVIRYDTSLESNNLGLKNSEIVFNFVDGCSNNKTVNDVFSVISRYTKIE